MYTPLLCSLVLTKNVQTYWQFVVTLVIGNRVIICGKQINYLETWETIIHQLWNTSTLIHLIHQLRKMKQEGLAFIQFMWYYYASLDIQYALMEMQGFGVKRQVSFMLLTVPILNLIDLFRLHIFLWFYLSFVIFHHSWSG